MDETKQSDPGSEPPLASHHETAYARPDHFATDEAG